MPSKPRRPLPSRAAEGGALPWGSQLRRGELYRVRHPSGDTKRSRVVVVVSRPAHLASRFSTAICAPVYSQRGGLSTDTSQDHEYTDWTQVARLAEKLAAAVRREPVAGDRIAS